MALFSNSLLPLPFDFRKTFTKKYHGCYYFKKKVKEKETGTERQSLENQAIERQARDQKRGCCGDQKRILGQIKPQMNPALVGFFL